MHFTMPIKRVCVSTSAGSTWSYSVIICSHFMAVNLVRGRRIKKHLGEITTVTKLGMAEDNFTNFHLHVAFGMRHAACCMWHAACGSHWRWIWSVKMILTQGHLSSANAGNAPSMKIFGRNLNFLINRNSCLKFGQWRIMIWSYAYF